MGGGGLFSSLSSIAPNSLDSLRHTDPQVVSEHREQSAGVTHSAALLGCFRKSSVLRGECGHLTVHGLTASSSVTGC